MNQGKTVFSQTMNFLPLHEFRGCVRRYQGDYRIHSFTCFDQYLCMSFAQLTYRESLRDIETCLRSVPNKLYHMGIRSNVARNTLAKANENRDWRIYADFAQVLIGTARKLYAKEDFGIELDNTVYALDASTIDLCLSLFPWAHFRRTKSAIKLHTLLDLRGNIPTFIEITDGKVADVLILDTLIPEPGAFYIMDRGYFDFKRLYVMHSFGAFFVIREKRRVKCRRLYSREVDKTTGLRYDQTVVLVTKGASKDYPEKLRRIRFYDKETDRIFVFFTNNFLLPALTIAQLYKARWQVELFFKWIKQHLRIKKFYGTSENTVKTQIWIAISTYLLVAIIKKRLNLQHSLYTILQILSVTAFEKVELWQLLTKIDYTDTTERYPKQLNLFDL